MSVFFVILRGQNDGTLDWPFHYSVTFSLLGQSDSTQVDDLAITFVPNPIEANIGFLGRPTTARNHMLGGSRSLAHSLAGWLTGWLAGWLAGSLAGWLAGWLAGCSARVTM